MKALFEKLTFTRKLTITTMNAETSRALTPVFLATIGGVIGVAVLVTPN